MISKQLVIDEINIDANRVVLWRETTRIIEDEVEIAKSYHRASVAPGSDVVNAPQIVKDICATIWTGDVVESYGKMLAQEQLQFQPQGEQQ